MGNWLIYEFQMMVESGPALFRVIGLRFMFHRDQLNDIQDCKPKLLYGCSTSNRRRSWLLRRKNQTPPSVKE